MPAVVKFNHSEPYTQRHLSLQHARDKSSIFWPKHLHAHKCISGCGVDVKAVRSRDSDRRDFDTHPNKQNCKIKKRCVRRDSNLETFGHEAETLRPELLCSYH